MVVIETRIGNSFPFREKKSYKLATMSKAVVVVEARYKNTLFEEVKEEMERNWRQ